MRHVAQGLAIALSVSFPSVQAVAQNFTIFNQQSICDSKTELVDKTKFFEAAVNAAIKEPGIGFAKISNANFTIDKTKLYEVNRAHFNNFKTEFLDDPSNTFFELIKGRTLIKSGKDLVDHAGAYEIKCHLPQTTTVRKEVDNFTKKISANLTVGKDLDALSKPLAPRNPAKFSVARDQVTGNTAFQTEFAVAGYFPTQGIGVTDPLWTGGKSQTIFVDFYPFVTSQTTSNTTAKLKDIEKTSIGLMLVTDNVPFFGLGANHFAFRASHQLDTTKTFEINLGEIVWTPDFGPFRALDFGKTKFLSGPDGLWYRHELSGRLRAGQILENNGIATLPSSGEVVRAGFRAELYAGVLGSDFFSKFTASLSYTHFDNLYGGNGVDQFHKVVAGLQYDLTDNYGFGITYTRGRDEDLLTEVDQILAAVTIKFGGKVVVTPP